MKKSISLLSASFIVLLNLNSQIVLKEPLSQRQTYYRIDASLDTKDKVVYGKMETYWVNKSSDIISEVQMHLYLNAFRSSRTTFNMESGWFPSKRGTESGWINLKGITDRNGRDLLPDLQYISPDDGNIFDSTVVRIILPRMAGPGDTVFLDIVFESKLPSRIIRTGYNDDFYFVGQWFPKFGVYESAGMRYATEGGWNCHQFHRNSEFYSNHSVYDVNITVPEKYVVGSGGMLTDEQNNGEGLKTLTFRAEDIVDFAWTAWPYYRVVTDQWKHVKIRLLLPPERESQIQRQLTAVKDALEYFEKNVGPFPWPYLTFVDPPSKGQGSGGMEYTTIFTSMSFTGAPAFLHFPEMVTVHEFGHAYFMGILASNEFEEPWLDEGVNQFWETRIMDHYYGSNTSLIDNPFFSVSDKSSARASYVHSASRQVITNKEYAWNYPHGTYSMMSYSKTAVCLRTLMGLIGEESMNDIFREYYLKWAFRHPSGKDFMEVVNEVVTKEYGDKFGPDMNWFFNETLFGNGICDYKVINLNNTRIHTENAPSDTLTGKSGTRQLSDSLYTAVVELERAGEVTLPVEVLVHFENGTEANETWDGKSRYKDFKYTGRGKAEWVKIDPDNKNPMDINLINNSMTLDPDRVPVRRISGKLTLLLQVFISIISI